jgi:pseudouridine synthase
MVDAKGLEFLKKGVDIGEQKPSVCRVLKTRNRNGRTVFHLELHEGRKRQIRRTFEALGYKVMNLKRINYAGIGIDIKEGSYRSLKSDEISRLKKK